MTKKKLGGVFEQISEALEEREGSDRRGDDLSSDRRSGHDQPAVEQREEKSSDRRQRKERRDTVE